MTQPPLGPPPGDPGRPDRPPLPPPVPPGPADGGAPSQPPGWSQPSWQQQPTPHQPQWHQLPPEQLARMHQPGVVPLRPLTLGDIFGGALQTMRRNPEATIGMGFIVLAVLLAPSLLLSLLMSNALTSLSDVDLQAVNLLLSTIFSSLASIALTGMIVHVVGEAVLGDRAGLGDTWRAVRGRLLALVGTVLLMGVLAVIAIIALVVVIAGLVAVGDGALVILLVVLLSIAAVVGFVWAACRLSLAPAPVVLERIGPWKGIARAWSLSRGGQGWRIVGITILAGIVTSVLAAVVQLPVAAAVMAALGPTGMMDPMSPTLLVTDHALQLVVGALTIPFTAGVTALLYLDQRIRREGLDVSLVRAAQERAASRSR
ncbi:hypothetical protein [Serinicoccus kebangsaanensis]|uniref:hypothetical protein n=1 Tax=Serinicoccus kebangsaanensis TaxID=2602069 RepID=UPI00124F2A01|nr:hypothetical protein [Serinicoccus kebangsaanensis]